MDFQLDAATINELASELPPDAIFRQATPLPPEPTSEEPEQDVEPVSEEDSQGEPESLPVPPAAPPAPPEIPTPPSPRTLTDEEYATFEFYRQLDRRLQTDPAFAAQFQQALQPTPTAPTPPPESPVYEDPALQALRAELDALRPVVNKWDQYLNNQAQVEAAATVSRAKDAFKTLHSLTDDQTEKVYAASELYAASVPTMLSKGMDQQTVLLTLMDAAFWANEDFRKIELERTAKQREADATRKAKAGSLTGSSGSLPRTAPAPQNESERLSAMAQAIREGITE